MKKACSKEPLALLPSSSRPILVGYLTSKLLGFINQPYNTKVQKETAKSSHFPQGLLLASHNMRIMSSLLAINCFAYATKIESFGKN